MPAPGRKNLLIDLIGVLILIASFISPCSGQMFTPADVSNYLAISIANNWSALDWQIRAINKINRVTMTNPSILSFSPFGWEQNPAPVDVSSYVTVTTANERSTLDRRTRTITSTADVTITNVSGNTISSPLHAVILIADANGTVKMPEALGGPDTEPYGNYYYDLSSKLANSQLPPEAGVTFSVKFVRDSAVRFRYSVSTYRVPSVSNQPPVADAGEEQKVGAGDSVTLDGRNSTDPDGDLITFEWMITEAPSGSNAILNNPESDMPTFIPDKLGYYVITLTVNDGELDSAPGMVGIEVVPPPGPQLILCNVRLVPTIAILALGVEDCSQEAFVQDFGSIEGYMDDTVVSVTLNGVLLPDGVEITDQGAILWGLRQGNSFYADVKIPEVDGIHPFTAVATDANGMRSEATMTFIRDTVPPGLSITSPGDGLVTSIPTHTITGTMDDPLAVVNFEWANAVIPVVNGVFSTQVTLEYEGPNYILFTARDPAFNFSHAGIQIILDTIPPQINIGSPSEGMAINTATLNVTGNIIDQNRDTLTLRVNDGPPQSLTLVSGNFSGTVALNPGSNALTFYSVDKAGNTGSATRSVLLDPGPPIVSITAPASGSFVTGVINVTVEASDPMSGVGSVGLYVDNQHQATLTQGPFNFSLDTSGLSSESHTLTAIAMDRTGNQAEASDTITIDPDPPVVTITSPGPGSVVSGTITITVEASDSISGVSSGTLLVDGQPQAALNQPPFDIVLDTSSLSSGSHVITARILDRVGNQGEASVSITVIESIRVEITSPADGATINQSSIIVQGRIHNQTGEVGVVVNGILAGVQGSDFAAMIPLQTGQNIITAASTRPDGVQRQTSITINTETQQEFIRLTATPASGVPDQTGNLEITFEAEAFLTNPIISYSWDLDGDGTPENTGAEPEMRWQYQSPGIYFPKLTVTDNQGATYTETTLVHVLSREEMDALLRSKWEGMKGALSQGNIDEALNYFIKDSREEYREIFELLAPQLPALVSAMREINMVQITGNRAEYYIKRFQREAEISYFIYFMRDENGIWRISSF